MCQGFLPSWVAAVLDEGSAISAGKRNDCGSDEPRCEIRVTRPVVRQDFLGIEVDRLTFEEALSRARIAMQNGERLQHCDLNVAKFVACRNDESLYQCILDSDMICTDGMGILVAARLLGLDLGERIAGVDLMYAILKMCEADGFRPYFLGAKNDILQRALSEVRRRYPRIRIAGSRHGYFSPDEEAEIVHEIHQSKADCLFVGISSPIKERFLNTYRDELGVPLQLGVGGAFDVLAGEKKRAPVTVQRAGFEWLYRMIQEPRRLGPRYLSSNIQFAHIVFTNLIRHLTAR